LLGLCFALPRRHIPTDFYDVFSSENEAFLVMVSKSMQLGYETLLSSQSRDLLFWVLVIGSSDNLTTSTLVPDRIRSGYW